MTFLWPQCLLLLFLLPLVLRWSIAGQTQTLRVIRCALFVLLVVLLARPVWKQMEPGLDVWVCVDRSASIDAEGLSSQSELLKLLSRSSNRGQYDRIALVTFGRSASLVQEPVETAVSIPDDLPAAEHASDIARALELVAERRLKTRRSRVVLLSDGLYTGRDPLAADVLATLGGMPVWVRSLEKSGAEDVAAGEVTPPQQAVTAAAYLVRFSVDSAMQAEARVRLSRPGRILFYQTVKLNPGANPFVVRDIADSEGTLEYTLTVDRENDPRPENNRSVGLLRVVSSPRVLVVGMQQQEGILDQLLRKSAIPFDRKLAGQVDFSAAKLSPYRVVILENMPLDKIGDRAVSSLALAVSRGICGLVVTGGKNSFGQGGYHKSALDPVLPVTMELREEQRRGMLALVTVLDRSGSMMAPVSGGKTKMDLADAATAEAVKLLSPTDQVSVIAVDSAEHVVVPLVRADDTRKLVDTIMRIESMGGGIFVKTGLDAAAREIRKSKLPTRHILIFADAADSEEQDGCLDLATELVGEGITVGVIALGTEGDCDAGFLKDLAATGKGEIYFTTSAGELPRMFSQQVIRISRRGFVGEETGTKGLPDLVRLKLPGFSIGPSVGGYSLSSLRPGASCALMTADDYAAPVVSFWQKGRASVAAVTAEVDGPNTGALFNWKHSPQMLINLVRLVAAGIQSGQGKATVISDRGHAQIAFEFEPEQAQKLRSRTLSVELLPPQDSCEIDDIDPVKTESGTPFGQSITTAATLPKRSVALTWISPTIAVADADLDTPGHYLPVLNLDNGKVLKAPAATMPYSPEFMPTGNVSGQKRLAMLAEVTGGTTLVSADDVFDQEGLDAEQRYAPMDPWVLIPLLLLFLLEVAQRRLGLLPDRIMNRSSR